MTDDDQTRVLNTIQSKQTKYSNDKGCLVDSKSDGIFVEDNKYERFFFSRNAPSAMRPMPVFHATRITTNYFQT